MNGLEKFLLDENLNDQTFNSSYRPIIIHKEKYNDRFTYIFTRDYNEYLSNQAYRLSAYLDVKDKVIYDTDYNLEKILAEDSILKRDSFENLEKVIKEEVKQYVDNYALENSDVLKKLSQEKYDEKDDWRIVNYQKGIRQLFIREDNPQIKLDRFYSIGKLEQSKEYYNRVVINEYLEDKQGTIKKYGDMVIEDNKEELGLALHLFDDKNKYLNRIKTNPGNEFKDLYINKKIYDSIKYESAKTINITIRYNGKEMTFKGDYARLKLSLASDDRGTYFYGVAYDAVSNFIKENTNSENKWKDEFEFSHISSITYGKKELYRNDNIKDKKQIDRDER